MIKKKKVYLIVTLCMLIFGIALLYFKSRTHVPTQQEIAEFVINNQQTLESIKAIAFEDPRNLQLEPGRRNWYDLVGDNSTNIMETEEVSILYDKLRETNMICSIFEEQWSDDQGTISFPVIQFQNYYDESRKSYHTIGCVYIDAGTPLDVSQYKFKRLEHIVGNWYYFRFLPQI